MSDKSEMPPDLAQVLRRYLEIQCETQRLREEKERLQVKLGEYLRQRKLSAWYPDLDGQSLKVKYQETPIVEYDEAGLSLRLGERYAAILEPDLRKIRRNLSALGSVLAPMLTTIGSPTPERVRAAIESGVVQKDEFAGLFKKSLKQSVAVMRLQPDAASDSGNAKNSHNCSPLVDKE